MMEKIKNQFDFNNFRIYKYLFNEKDINYGKIFR